MAGSPQGREALVPTQGCKHCSNNDLKESAGHGCCLLIWSEVLTSKKSWRRPDTWESSAVAGPSSGKPWYLKFWSHVYFHDSADFYILISAGECQ
jgi:hypothetical protein